MAINTHILFSVFSFIGFVLCFIPLYWHWEAWNIGTCTFMIWTGLECLMFFINSRIWAGNVVNWAPIWCDISSRFILGCGVAIPAASLSVMRSLYRVANPTSATAVMTKSEKRRNIIIDLSICLGIPVLQMILQYIVSGHRFDIYEDIGCFPATYNTYPAFVLVFAWPLVLGVVAAAYGTLTIISLIKRHKLSQPLITPNENLTNPRYFRLMALACVDVVFTIPLSIYFIWADAALGIQPWISWEDTHYYYSRVGLFPKSLYRQDPSAASAVELTQWAPVMCAIVFFAFFGFAEEARKHYRLAFTSVAKRLGYTFPEKHEVMCFKTRSEISRRVSVTKDMERSRDSMLSFSDRGSTSIYICGPKAIDDFAVKSPTEILIQEFPSPPPLPVGLPPRTTELDFDTPSTWDNYRPIEPNRAGTVLRPDIV